MKLKQRLVKKQIAGEYVYVAVKDKDTSYEGIVTASESGAMLLDALTEDTTLDELADILVKNYDVDTDTAVNDARAFTDMLRTKDLISD